MKILILIIFFGLTTSGFAQLEEILKKYAEGDKKGGEELLKKEMASSFLRDISIFNPYQGYKTSLDSFLDDILNNAGYISNNNIIDKINTIIGSDLIYNVKMVKYSGRWVSLRDLYNNYGFNIIFSYYKAAKEAHTKKDNAQFSANIILLMDSISRIAE